MHFNLAQQTSPGRLPCQRVIGHGRQGMPATQKFYTKEPLGLEPGRFSPHARGQNGLDSMLRCVGPQHAQDLGLRAEIDCTEARKSATPRSADIREGVGYSGMQRGI
jgi:hypothetical protein